MTRLLVPLLALMSFDARADERGADQLRAFIVDACEFFGEHHPITAEEAQPHFGKLRKREWVTKHVGTPHARFHIDAKRLPGWPVSLENLIEVKVKLPHDVRITVDELEKVVGHAENDDVGDAPEHFSIDGLGPTKMCTVIIEGDGKSSRDGWRNQRVISITIDD